MFLQYYAKQFKSLINRVGLINTILFSCSALLDKTLFKIYRELIAKPLLNQYAFLGEDIFIEYKLGKKQLSYIDVGCNDPIEENMTYRFYKNGGGGVNIDPNPGIIEKCKVSRSNDININAGVSCAGNSNRTLSASPKAVAFY